MLADNLVRRIVNERADGRTLREIADGLTADGVPTARGAATWRTSTVQGVLNGQDAARVAAEAAVVTV